MIYLVNQTKKIIMKMNKDKYTLNHIIGAYVDGSDYPTKDDVLYSLEKWFWYEGGKAFIEDRNIEHNEYACFADSNIEEIFEKSKYVKKNYTRVY